VNQQRRIIHCLRAPVGGLFRHVCDLVRAQSDMGHAVGIICDSRTGGDAAQERIDAISDSCALGIRRIAMSRQLGPSDFFARGAVRRFAAATNAEILHGHGAKGGAYARLIAPKLRQRGQNIRAFYTPHGGSLHFDRSTLSGRLFLTLERRLAPRSDGIIFESEYAAGLYKTKIGDYPCQAFIIPNGLWPDEFYQTIVDDDAADFLFVGELRALKGIDVMLKALADLRRRRPVTAVIVGSGPDEREYRQMAKRFGLQGCVTFAGAIPARTAFPRGGCLVVPSRAESFPYIVLEAAAAALPMILTNVGGIPEIVAGAEIELVPPGEPHALRAQMEAWLDDPAEFVERAKWLQSVVSQRYQATVMARLICAAYESVLEAAPGD
jgi:glycosyltransferase involved in cell wall biosynthesis